MTSKRVCPVLDGTEGVKSLRRAMQHFIYEGADEIVVRGGSPEEIHDLGAEIPLIWLPDDPLALSRSSMPAGGWDRLGVALENTQGLHAAADLVGWQRISAILENPEQAHLDVIAEISCHFPAEFVLRVGPASTPWRDVMASIPGNLILMGTLELVPLELLGEGADGMWVENPGSGVVGAIKRKLSEQGFRVRP